MHKDSVKPSDENGRPHGQWINYTCLGRYIYKGEYIHGIRDGLWLSYRRVGDSYELFNKKWYIRLR